jgi:hypothetical protein
MPEGLNRHPEDATVTVGLNHYLALKESLEGQEKKLAIWKEGLEHVEVFMSFLRSEEEDLMAEHIETFNNTYDEAQIRVKNGKVSIDIRPEGANE